MAGTEIYMKDVEEEEGSLLVPAVLGKGVNLFLDKIPNPTARSYVPF